MNCVFMGIKWRVRNKIMHPLPWITILRSFVMRFGNNYHSWLLHSSNLLTNRPTRDLEIVIHGHSCTILYLYQHTSSWATSTNILPRCTWPSATHPVVPRVTTYHRTYRRCIYTEQLWLTVLHKFHGLHDFYCHCRYSTQFVVLRHNCALMSQDIRTSF